MNAPPNIDPVTAHSGSDVMHWLTNDTRDERFIDNIFAELCVRLQQAGIPVKRASLHILIHHPQWLGARIMWADGMREAVIERVDYDVRERSEYIDSPASEIHDGATEVRENLERDPSLGRKHAVYDEMRAKGLTDYVAWPLYHTLGKRHLVTFATDRLGGFDHAQLAGLLKLSPALSGYVAVLQIAEGVPEDPIVVPITLEGAVLSFEMRSGKETLRYRGTVRPDGLYGRFDNDAFSDREDGFFLLRRGRSYWQD